MKKTPFNPQEWLPKSDPNTIPAGELSSSEIPAERVERGIQLLEASGKDITSGYSAWLKICYALTSEFGENGRSYFHRVSKFHPGYRPEDCDKQYERCLRSKGSGITLATFFHYLKSAGIHIPSEPVALPRKPLHSVKEGPHPIENPFTGEFNDAIPLHFDGSSKMHLEQEQEEAEQEKEVLPVFPDRVHSQLPELLQKVTAPGSSPEEKDILLLGALTCLSSCLPGVHGYYDGARVMPNLYLFVTAPASAGKGRLTLCKNLVLPIHWALREEGKALQQEYENELAIYNASKNDTGEKPRKPAEKMLFIPVNSSSSGVFQLLHDNNSRGLLFESEGESMGDIFRTDFGNYSTGFRKAFHHENISYYRKTDREYVNLEEPALSTVLSGTPAQVSTLIPNAENGLFSRFMFYYMNLEPVWKDVFENRLTEDLPSYFLDLGKDFLTFHNDLNSFGEVKIALSREQKRVFNAYFSHQQLKYLALQPETYVATVRRLGLICFRLCMLFSMLRMKEEGKFYTYYQCDDKDFELALSMVGVLIQHSSSVYYRLPEQKLVQSRSSRKERFLNSLPSSFSKSDYAQISEELKIPIRTSEKFIELFIAKGLVTRESKGNYSLVELSI